MTGRELWAALLQEAISGRLVEQRDEEPEVQQIGAPPEDVPFEIPGKWKWVKLKELFQFIDYRGKTPQKSQDGIRLMTASNIKQGYIDHTRIEYISKEEFLSRQSRGISCKGDILFTTEAPLGNAALADLDIYSAGQRVITLKSSVAVHSLYVFFILTPYFQGVLIDNATGTTAKGIKAARLKELFLPLPPREEQRRIVAKLEELRPHVDEYSHAEERLSTLTDALPDRLRASILQEAIQGKLVPQNPNDEPASILLDRINNERKKLIKNGKIKGKSLTSLITKQNEGLFYEVSSKSNTYLDEQIPFEIPENWAWARLTDISYSVGNRDNQIKSSQVQETGKFPVISQSKEFIDGYCNFEEKLVIDIPVVMFGDHTKSVKYIDFDFVIGADGTKFHKIIYMNSKYIYYWMQYAANKLHDRGYARHYILLKKELIPIPPLAEQHRIVAKLEQILPEIGKLAT